MIGICFFTVGQTIAIRRRCHKTKALRIGGGMRILAVGVLAGRPRRESCRAIPRKGRLGSEFSAPAETEREPEAAARSFENPARAPRSHLNQSSAESHSLRRWRARRRLLPEPATPQNLFDHLALAPFDAADDLHLGATFGAKQWVHLVHLFDQGRPPFPSCLGAGSRRWLRGGGAPRLGLRLGRHSPALVRVESGRMPTRAVRWTCGGSSLSRCSVSVARVVRCTTAGEKPTQRRLAHNAAEYYVGRYRSCDAYAHTESACHTNGSLDLLPAQPVR